MTAASGTVAGSFRDPSGFVFRRNGAVYRQVNQVFREHYDHFMRSGLYEALTVERLLVPHEEVTGDGAASETAYKTLRPRMIPFVSYPYEWCFRQLKDAALTTLRIQQTALGFGMTLKDASAYNIQFLDGGPLLIDTLSFEIYREGEPWVAYRQFCQHFLAPLLLMAARDERLGRLLSLHVDGIPLDLAVSLLPRRTLARPGVFTHLYLHAKSQQRYARRPAQAAAQRKVSRLGLRGLIDSLASTVERLRWRPAGFHWADYYDSNSYSENAIAQKREWVSEFLEIVRPESVWDLGANTGMFSLLAASKGIPVVAFDMDHGAIEALYNECLRRGETRVLPLLVDLTNPSAAIGWANNEREALLQRGPASAVLALALVHHLALTHNVPLDHIARFLRLAGRALIIEFVPKDDPQAQRLLASRPDIFDDYCLEAFEQTFSRRFSILRRKPIPDSARVLYLMEAREGGA